MKYLLAFVLSFVMQISNAQSLDKLLAAPNKTAESVGSINPAADTHASDDDLRRRVNNIDQINASRSLSSGSSSSSTGSAKAAGVTSIRSETYDNAGRKTEGYWVRCSRGGETRVYRSAWDRSPDWFSPNGLGTTNFLAKSSASINDVAQSICK
jgi:hypothetical protein